LKVLVVQCSPTLCHFFLLRPNIILSTIFSYTFNLSSFFSVRDHVSHSCKTTGKKSTAHFIFCESQFGNHRNKVKSGRGKPDVMAKLRSTSSCMPQFYHAFCAQLQC
jgi:hypothetical protein